MVDSQARDVPSEGRPDGGSAARPGSARERVTDALRTLVAGLAPGTRLSKVEVLARRYGVSSGTVGRALRALAAEGLVESPRGWVVAGGPPRPDTEDGRVADQLRAADAELPPGAALPRPGVLAPPAAEGLVENPGGGWVVNPLTKITWDPLAVQCFVRAVATVGGDLDHEGRLSKVVDHLMAVAREDGRPMDHVDLRGCRVLRQGPDGPVTVYEVLPAGGVVLWSMARRVNTAVARGSAARYHRWRGRLAFQRTIFATGATGPWSAAPRTSTARAELCEWVALRAKAAGIASPRAELLAWRDDRHVAVVVVPEARSVLVTGVGSEGDRAELLAGARAELTLMTDALGFLPRRVRP